MFGLRSWDEQHLARIDADLLEHFVREAKVVVAERSKRK